MLTAYFYHKTTGLPLTDGLVTVSVTLANMNNDTKVLDNAPMTASTSFLGAFRHLYALDTEIDYMALYSCSDSNYTASVDKLLIPARSTGGGGFNVSGIQTTIRNSRDSIVQEFDKKLLEMEQKIKKEFNDTNSHIDIAKDDLMATLYSIEQPEMDISEITLGIGVLKQRFTKLSDYLRKESNSEKELIKKELEDKIEKIEQAYKEMETAHSKEIESKTSELSEKEELIAEMEETARELMEIMEEEGKANKDEVEKEVKNKIISSLSE